MKNFITLSYVPCFVSDEFGIRAHRLSPNLDYETNNPRFDKTTGDFYFALYDEEGFIGDYSIAKKHLHLIQEISFVESEN